jgi:hypothetical protein
MSEKRSTVNASELVATFTDYDTRVAPYEGLALRIRLVADVLTVDVGRLIEDATGERFECDNAHSIGVDAEALYQTLGIMLRRDDREASDRLREGTLPANHPSLRLAPVSQLVPSTRVRA